MGRYARRKTPLLSQTRETPGNVKGGWENAGKVFAEMWESHKEGLGKI